MQTSENSGQPKFAESLFHEALTLSSIRISLPDHYRPTPHGTGAQAVLCFGTCIDAQNHLRSSEEAIFRKPIVHAVLWVVLQSSSPFKSGGLGNGTESAKTVVNRSVL